MTKEEILYRIRDLQQQLTSPLSELGDWKIIKYTEYVAAGLEEPFDMKELHKQRQAVRDEIEELQKEL